MTRLNPNFLYVVTYGHINILAKFHERSGTVPEVMAKKLIS